MTAVVAQVIDDFMDKTDINILEMLRMFFMHFTSITLYIYQMSQGEVTIFELISQIYQTRYKLESLHTYYINSYLHG